MMRPKPYQEGNVYSYPEWKEKRYFAVLSVDDENKRMTIVSFDGLDDGNCQMFFGVADLPYIIDGLKYEGKLDEEFNVSLKKINPKVLTK